MSGYKDATGNEIPADNFENDGGVGGKLKPQAQAANDAFLNRLKGGQPAGKEAPTPEKPAPKSDGV